MSSDIDYKVIILTRCRSCAMALAGHAPKLGSIRAAVVFALGEGSDGGPLTIHSNTTTIKAHDGTPFLCKEHGRMLDLTRDVEGD